MPHYRFGWISNAVETSWWVENLEDGADAALRAGGIMDQIDTQVADEDPSELPMDIGGVVWEPATAEEIHLSRESAGREVESVPLIPPEDLIL